MGVVVVTTLLFTAQCSEVTLRHNYVDNVLLDRTYFIFIFKVVFKRQVRNVPLLWNSCDEYGPCLPDQD